MCLCGLCLCLSLRHGVDIELNELRYSETASHIILIYYRIVRPYECSLISHKNLSVLVSPNKEISSLVAKSVADGEEGKLVYGTCKGQF